jgi:hypothetical protein
MQTYNTSSNKSTRKNEKVSEKFDPRIIRSPHDRKNPYVMINKHLMHDESVSPLCRFFLIQLLSKPENWDFRTSALINEFTWLNEKKVHKFWREGMANGYVKRVDILEKGRRIDCIYYVAENPIYLEDSNNFARNSQKRSCENGSDIISNDIIYKRNNTKKLDTSPSPKKQEPPATPPPSAIIIFKDEKREIAICHESYASLETKLGKTALEETLESIKSWLAEEKKRKFSKNNIEKKIIEWNARFNRSKRHIDRSKENEEAEQRERNKLRAEGNRRENEAFLARVTSDERYAGLTHVIGDCVLIKSTGKWYNLFQEGLPKWLEMSLNIKLE